ncbi:MAG: MGH1-like glycoside hydrolase domain-containing protein [Cyclobacteriaceae bacterium]
MPGKTQEHLRLLEDKKGIKWKSWGPYLSERQWATVREDYSEDGNVWESVIHDHARSKAFRWGEDGIGGFSNEDQRICFSWAFWNGKDPILKERLFGLTSYEGNHGEDVKEYYYYLDSTPTHSYMKMLYKYPLSRFPYEELVDRNKELGKEDNEFELIDTGIFEKDEYVDIFLEYTKNEPEDFLLSATLHNRSDYDAEIVVLPTLWFRNTWSSGRDRNKPIAKTDADQRVKITHHLLGTYYMYFDQAEDLIFCDNETNRERLYESEGVSKYPKDGINDYIVDGKLSVNPKKEGTKTAGVFKVIIKAKSQKQVRLRISKKYFADPFHNFKAIYDRRKHECDEFYKDIQNRLPDEEIKSIQRQAFAGMMWSKQFYYYNVKNWLHGDPGRMAPPKARKGGRNNDWTHLYNYDVVSMPDKWEYPWYAAWDLAFHTIPIARIDPEFAKHQLLLFLSESYLHPNGQIPAYEWNFSDVNPPVHAWAVTRVFRTDRKLNGEPDYEFLLKAFHKLLINFTWWVNRKDENGNNIFEGGFLGLDNIGVFDRNHPIVEDAHLEQADSTSWMAMFALNMLRMSLDLSVKFPVYQDMAIKFFEHFLYIGGAMNSIGDTNVDLWDEEDNFYYDVIHTPHEHNRRLKVRSMVGLIPLYAVEILKSDFIQQLPQFRERLEFFMKERPLLSSLVARWSEQGVEHRRLLSIMRGFRMKKVLEKMVDESEFLSNYGIRALSKFHEKNPYVFEIEEMKLSVSYLPGESDSSMFGGNSNWRGPIWFPVNYLILESLLKYHYYYGPEFKIEYPSGSGEFKNLQEVAKEICARMIRIFRQDEKGNRPVFGEVEKFQKDEHFKDHILFYEYFHGDSGAGLGASHQTGWTGLIAEMIDRYYS